MTKSTDLVDRICNTTMVYFAEMLRKVTTPDVDLACKLLRTEVKAGYDGLVAELKEADEAFFGQQGPLTVVFNAGCLKFAADAWVKYQAAKAS